MTVHLAPRNKDNPFTQISNSILLDKNISGIARLVIWYAISRPKNWVFNERDICNSLNIGRYAARASFKQLEVHGYLERQQSRENGRFSTPVWNFYEKPKTHKESAVSSDSTAELKKKVPKTENPSTENQTLLILRSNNKGIKEDNVTTLPSHHRCGNVHKRPLKQEQIAVKAAKEECHPTKKLNRFLRKLSPEQHKLYDEIISHEPKNGRKLRPEDVTAWFLAHKRPVSDVRRSFEYFVQQEQKGRQIVDMGAYMVYSMRNENVRPEDDGFRIKKRIAQELEKQHCFIKTNEKYVTIYNGRSTEDLDYKCMSPKDFKTHMEMKIDNIMFMYQEACEV